MKKSTLRKLRNYYKLMGIQGLLFHFRNKFVLASKEVGLRIPGIHALVILRMKTSDIGTFRQIFLDRGYDFEVTAQPRYILDAGANIGLASIIFANRYPQATIIAVEPEASNFEILKKNAAPYGKRIIPVQAALWNENTHIHLVDPGLGKWGFQAQNLEDGVAPPSLHPVQALTVDRIMQEYGIEHFDIVKIDIEGSEKEVFADASMWIDKVGMLIVELHDRYRVGCNRSFYNATNNFEMEWHHGENVCLVKHDAFLGDSYRVRAKKGVIS